MGCVLCIEGLQHMVLGEIEIAHRYWIEPVVVIGNWLHFETENEAEPARMVAMEQCEIERVVLAVLLVNCCWHLLVDAACNMGRFSSRYDDLCILLLSSLLHDTSHIEVIGFSSYPYSILLARSTHHSYADICHVYNQVHNHYYMLYLLSDLHN